MKYVYKNLTYVNRDSKGVLYCDGRILFIGNTWSGILQFLSAAEYAPEVKQMFKSQLEQREVLKLNQQKLSQKFESQ